MTSSAQYSALTRLLTHNTRVHQLEDLLLQLPMPPEAAAVNGVARSLRFDYEYECEQDKTTQTRSPTCRMTSTRKYGPAWWLAGSPCPAAWTTWTGFNRQPTTDTGARTPGPG